MQLPRKTSIIQEKNIFDNYKIVINSPDVHFGIKRQHAKVGTKL
jgi:hypothetical protein